MNNMFDKTVNVSAVGFLSCFFMLLIVIMITGPHKMRALSECGYTAVRAIQVMNIL